MNWDDLKLFLMVSRQAKLERASLQLGIDATTISRRLRRLESDLGQTLFERTRRGHLLTPQGELLAERVEAIESRIFAIEQSGVDDNSISGTVRLGVTEGFGTKFVAPALADLSNLWPQLDIDLIALSGFVSVPKREADMSILLTRPKSGRINVRKLTDYTLQLYGARSYLDRHEPIRSTHQLAHHRLIGYVDDLIYSPQLQYFNELLPGLSHGLSSPSILAQVELTRGSAGLCILPKFIASLHSELVPVLTDEINVTRSFWLAIHQDVSEFRRIRTVADFLINLIAKNQTRLV